MSDTLTTLLTTAGGAFLGKFVGPAAEAMGKAAWERAQQLGAKATALLGAVGREPQPVEPKLLVPLVQAAGLETDTTLAELWAALLANAADPAQQAPVQSVFVTILRDLTVSDARILQTIAEATDFTANKFIPTISWLSTISGFEVSIDKLTRDNLCVSVGNSVPQDGYHPFVSSVRPGKETVALTDLGQVFLLAVTAPALDS